MASRCGLCGFKIVAKHDFNLITGKTDYRPEFLDLPFPVVLESQSRYICKRCIELINKRKSHKKKLQEAETLLWNRVKEHNDNPVNTEKQIASEIEIESRLDDIEVKSPIVETTTRPRPIIASTPRAPPRKLIIIQDAKGNATSCRQGANYEQGESSHVTDGGRAATTVKLKICWPSKILSKDVPTDLVPLGVMLGRGTYKQIASAAWRHKEIRHQLIKIVLKEIDKECCTLCKKGKVQKKQNLVGANQAKEPKSIFRRTEQEDMINFSFVKMNQEIKGKAPLFMSILQAASLKRNKDPLDDRYLLQTTSMAAAVCLKNRCAQMTVVQLLISIIIQHSGIMVSFYLRLNIGQVIAVAERSTALPGHEGGKTPHQNLAKDDIEICSENEFGVYLLNPPPFRNF